MKKKVTTKKLAQIRLAFSFAVVLFFLSTYLIWLSLFPRLTISISEVKVSLPLPDFNLNVKTEIAFTDIELAFFSKTLLADYKAELLEAQRQAQIDRVERFFQSYGSPLVGYGYIFVDQSKACGGNYRVLVGIAGSESGLGRVMYKKYNPFGYLNGIQYSSLEEALTILSCQISQQHISKCGEDLYCLVRRYGGPDTDVELFVGKVRWFMNQV